MYYKTPAYGSHWLSWCVQIVALIPKQTETDKKQTKTKQKMSCVTCHFSCVPCYVSCFGQKQTKKQKMVCVMCHVSCVPCHVSHVTSHLSSLTDTATALPLLTPPVCTVGWFAKTQRHKNNKTHIIRTTENKQKMSGGVPILAIVLFDQKSPVHGEVGFLRWLTQTDNRRTLWLIDWPGPEGRVSKKWRL